MPLEITHLKQNEIVNIRYSGEVSLRDLQLERELLSKGRHSLERLLIDYEDVAKIPSVEEYLAFAHTFSVDTLKSMQRTAILIRDELLWRFSLYVRMMNYITSQTEYQIFFDRTEAKNWLLSDKTASSQFT